MSEYTPVEKREEVVRAAVDYRQDAKHYVAATDVVHVAATTPVVDVFSLLAPQASSIVIVHGGDDTRFYVNGRQLAKRFLDVACDAPALYDEQIGAFLPGGPLATEPIDYVVQLSPVVAEVTKAAEPPIPLGRDAASRDVYLVTANDTLEGYLFSHETFKNSAMTPPPKFICSRGHVNPDPDHGRCQQQCPGRIVKVQ